MQQTFFRAIEAMEEKFFTDVAALIVDLMSRLAREELSEDYLDDEAMTLLMDKERYVLSRSGLRGVFSILWVFHFMRSGDVALAFSYHKL